MPTKKSQIAEELEAIRSKNEDGLLVPREVVAWASAHKDSALHSQFDWNIEHAAEKYWLWQARRIIKVTIGVIKEKKTNIYVSLETQRVEPGGGYSPLVSVLSDAERRSQLLGQARRELDAWMRKYRELEELAEVFAAAENVLAEA